MGGYSAIVIGTSAGGIDALNTLLSGLPPDFPLPVIIVQHIANYEVSHLAAHFSTICPVPVKEAGELEAIMPGTVYMAPAGYHLLVEPDRTFSLSVDPRVNFSCPSIDVLFESAADAYGPGLIGVILTGASADGSAGLRQVKKKGGLAIVQSPKTAASMYMPSAAIAATTVDHIADLGQIASLLVQLAH